MPSIDEIVIADDPEGWAALGFTVVDRRCQLGSVYLRFVGPGEGTGIIGWSLRDVTGTDLDGLPTAHSRSAPPADPPEHANGARAIDHVVAMSPSLDRAVSALQEAGLDLRRVREDPTPAGAPRQAFFRLGAEILEVVQEPHAVVERSGGPDRPTRFWGLAVLVEDIERSSERFAPRVGPVRAAVQQGREIATVGRSAGLAVPVALMSPRVREEPSGRA